LLKVFFNFISELAKHYSCKRWKLEIRIYISGVLCKHTNGEQAGLALISQARLEQ